MKNCTTLGAPEDTQHVLFKCAATEEARVRKWEGEVLVEEPKVCRKTQQPWEIKLMNEDV